MIYLAVTAPWLIILALVWVLLEGQPAGQADVLTQNTSMRATLNALPRPTATRCVYLPHLAC